MITADEVQFSYPNPSNDPDDSTYCVGGALCLFLGQEPDLNFPASHSLARNLGKANPALFYPEAHDFARRIISKNDVGRFDEAWLALREALKWEPGE